MSGLFHLGCESCGSTLGIRDGQRLVTCTHCGSAYVASVPGFIPRFSLTPVVDAAGAERVARQTLRHAEVERAMAGSATVGRPQLYWVPFYEVDGLQVSTYVERAKGRDDTRLAFVDYQAQGCAEELASWGLADLRPRVERQKASVPLAPATGEALARSGHVLAVPPIPASAEAPHTPIAAKKEIVASGSTLLGIERRYVYHPIWRVEVRDRRHPYLLTVDGLSGDLLAGQLPQDRRFASLWLLVTLALFALLAGRSLHLGVSLRDVFALIQLWPLVLFFVGSGATVLVLAVAVFWSETRFRGEVVFSRRGTEVVKLGRPPETKLERWAVSFANAIERLVESSLNSRT